MNLEVLGLAGLLLIAGGWAISLQGPPPPLRLSVLYFSGSVLLTIYALFLGDAVFFVLNSAAALLSLLNILKSLRRGGEHRSAHVVNRR
jgi:lipid-A-disaccharide synthase-like uncharacterized protein